MAAESGIAEQVLHAAVLELHTQRALEERRQAVPGVGVLERLGGERGNLVKALREELVDELALVGPAPVGRADAHAGVVRDVVERDVQAALREQLGRRGQ